MSSAGSTEEKPFACPVPGCKKRYKNVNGIKYHAKNGHKKEAKYVLSCLLSQSNRSNSSRTHCGASSVSVGASFFGSNSGALLDTQV